MTTIYDFNNQNIPEAELKALASQMSKDLGYDFLADAKHSCIECLFMWARGSRLDKEIVAYLNKKGYDVLNDSVDKDDGCYYLHKR